MCPPRGRRRASPHWHLLDATSQSAQAPQTNVSVEPECSEVINGPNLGGFLGLAPDLRRLGRQGLAWLSGTQGLSGPGIWALRSSRQRLPRRPRGTPSQKALSSSSRQDFPAADLPRAADLRRRIFSNKALSSLHARTSQLRISREQRTSGGEFFLLGFS